MENIDSLFRYVRWRNYTFKYEITKFNKFIKPFKQIFNFNISVYSVLVCEAPHQQVCWENEITPTKYENERVTHIDNFKGSVLIHVFQ